MVTRTNTRITNSEIIADGTYINIYNTHVCKRRHLLLHQLHANTGKVTMFLSHFTYPSEVSYEDSVDAEPGRDGSYFIPAVSVHGDIVYCNLKGGDDGESDIGIICDPEGIMK